MSHHVAPNLSEAHMMGVARDINSDELRSHLIIEHGVSIKNLNTKAQLGRAHLLTHAVDGFPELRELLNLPENWGH